MSQMMDSGPADMVGYGSPNISTNLSRGQSGNKRPKSKWHLGIRSQSNQMHVMKEVYRALIELGFLWKNLSNFKIRVRMENKRIKGRYEKMNITLYKSPRCSDKLPDYLLDFSSCPMDDTNIEKSDWGATHSTMAFFEMCSKIINKLANN
jgi:5'-AMP-activated protein kinase catalytic alpha subunit